MLFPIFLLLGFSTAARFCYEATEDLNLPTCTVRIENEWYRANPLTKLGQMSEGRWFDP